MEEIALGLLAIKKLEKRRKSVNSLFLEREQYGFMKTLIPTLLRNESLNLEHDLYSYIRMDFERFNFLLEMIKCDIQPKSQSRPDSISAELKLIVTLRYLTEGESFNSLKNGFRISQNTISKIISETCVAVIDKVGKRYLSLPKTTSEWQEIQAKFYEKSNFPMVIGAIDHQTLEVHF